MDERATKISASLHEAGETHHIVYAERLLEHFAAT
jgi:hypothetical protein